MVFTQQPISEFLSALSSKAAVPGGGGASALAGALSASLGSMVCGLTIGKKKYAPVEPQIIEIREKLVEAREKLAVCMDEDALAFEPLSKAYGLPKETEEQQEHRRKVLEECLLTASQPPLKICETTASIVGLLEFLAKEGSRLAVSDVGCAAAFAITAMQAGALNVFINTKLMRDRETAEQLEANVQRILDEYVPRCQAVYESVLNAVK